MTQIRQPQMTQIEQPQTSKTTSEDEAPLACPRTAL
jgi:hypothetical protein